MSDVADALGARVVLGGSLGHEVRDVRVAAMSVEHFVEHLVDGALVIVPGDRPDILAATLAAALSPEMPAVAGVLLTGGQGMTDGTRRLLANSPFPVLEVDALTHEAAAAVPASAAGSGRRTSGRSRPRSGSSTRASTPTSWPSASRSSGRRG